MKRFGKKKIMQRGIGQHHADEILTGSDLFADVRFGFAAQQNNRARARTQQPAFGFTDMTMRCHRRKVGHHQSKRFIDAQFAPAKFGYGIRAGRVAGEMKTAQAFDGNDPAFGQ